MNTNSSVEVIAVDVQTGVVLDEDFEWFVGKPGQQEWRQTFDSQHDAVEFCEGQLRANPDVEFYLLSVDRKFEKRIINERWGM